MSKKRLTTMIRIVLALAFVVAVADRAAAGPILLTDFQVEVDTVGLVATITAGLQAQSDLFLDALSVDLSENGVPILDLFAGPTLLDAQPFFNLPFSLVMGEVLGAGTPLFRITGLAANASYAGSFALFQFEPDGSTTSLVSQAFAFSTAPAPIPEPATLLLMATGLGATGLLQRRRRRPSPGDTRG